MTRNVDTVIRNTPLRIVVCPYSLASLPTTNLPTPNPLPSTIKINSDSSSFLTAYLLHSEFWSARLSFTPLYFIEPRAQNLKRLVFVLQSCHILLTINDKMYGRLLSRCNHIFELRNINPVLGSFVLYVHCDARRNMNYSHSTVGGIGMLTPCPTRSVCVHSQVFIP